MSDKAKKKSVWQLLPKKRHLWPPTEWPKDPWFMRLYFIMITLILLFLGISFFRFFIFGTGSEEVSDNGMEVTIGITVGMFGILSTFAVVFFAFRAEETAVNVTGEEVKLFVDKAFDDEEEKFSRLLSSYFEEPSNFNDGGRKEERSIYGVDTPWSRLLAWSAQLLAWGAVAFLVIASGAFTLTSWSNSNDELKLQILTLWVGMLGILIAFTVIFFAARVAQISRIVGRIESHSTIGKLAALNEKLYHELFEVLDKMLIHKKDGKRPSPTAFRFELLQTSHQDFDENEKNDFENLLKDTPSPSNIFSGVIACAAVGMICFIGWDMLQEEASIRSIGSSAALFTLLIFSTSVFFLGRVFKSAIASSKEEAAKVSHFELNLKHDDLKNRIRAVREIEKNETSREEFFNSSSWKDMPASQMVNTLMHLHSLRAKEGSHPYFFKLCKVVEKRLKGANRNYEDSLLKLGKKFISEMDGYIRIKRQIGGKIKDGEIDEMIDGMDMILKEAREIHGKVLEVTDERRKRLKVTDMLEIVIPDWKRIEDTPVVNDYREEDFFICARQMEKGELEKHIKARDLARFMLYQLAELTQFCAMFKLLDKGLWILKEHIMSPKKGEDELDVQANGEIDAEARGEEKTKKAEKEKQKCIDDLIRRIIVTIRDNKLLEPTRLDLEPTKPVKNGPNPIFDSELIEVFLSVELLEGLNQIDGE